MPVAGAAVLVLVLGAVLLAGGSGLEARRLAPDVDAQLAFLRRARIVSARPIGKGVTRSLRLTLSDGELTHDASFQSVEAQARPADLARGKRTAGELQFVDSYRYNIAAWQLARSLGLAHMMPATVERTYRGRRGALSWWVDDVLMDEAERERTNRQPPDPLDVVRQRQRMMTFAELVQDVDRNKGNVLYTRDWRVFMIDFTRAFRLQPALRAPEALTSCDRSLLERLRRLVRADVVSAAGDHLTGPEIDAIMARRARLVEHVDALVARRGAAVVLY